MGGREPSVDLRYLAQSNIRASELTPEIQPIDEGPVIRYRAPATPDLALLASGGYDAFTSGFFAGDCYPVRQMKLA